MDAQARLGDRAGMAGRLEQILGPPRDMSLELPGTDSLRTVFPAARTAADRFDTRSMFPRERVVVQALLLEDVELLLFLVDNWGVTREQIDALRVRVGHRLGLRFKLWLQRILPLPAGPAP